MECDFTYEELARYAAGDSGVERSAEVERHAAGCPVCRRRLEALARSDVALRLLPPTAPSAAILLRTRQALTRELRGTGLPEIMTLEKVAEFLRVSAGELGEVVSDLPAFEVGGRIRVRREALLQWVEGRERAYAGARAQSEVARMLADLSLEEVSP
jgi:anti-sigma factor RsiW